MPNWVWNYVKISGTPARIKEIKEKANINGRVFNFEAFVPVDYEDPKYQNKEQGSGTEPGAGHEDFLRRDWIIDHWGTDRNAIDAKIDEEGDDFVRYSFSTAWHEPDKFWITFADMYPDVKIEGDCQHEIDEYIDEEEEAERELSPVQKFLLNWFNLKRTEDKFACGQWKLVDPLSCCWQIEVPLVGGSDWLDSNSFAYIDFVYRDFRKTFTIELAYRNDSLDVEKDDLQGQNKFFERLVAFDSVICKFAEDNGGRVLTEDESWWFWSQSDRQIHPQDVKAPIFVVHRPYFHDPSKKRFFAEIYFNEQDALALERMYAFWKEFGIPYWKDYLDFPQVNFGEIYPDVDADCFQKAKEAKEAERAQEAERIKQIIESRALDQDNRDDDLPF